MKSRESKMPCHVSTTALIRWFNTDGHIRVVAERLKQEGRHEIFEQETMEELEDDEGNVYNRKTYEDLKKQGLI
jgi:hypothetical protein